MLREIKPSTGARRCRLPRRHSLLFNFQRFSHRIPCPGCSQQRQQTSRRQGMFTRKWILISCAIPLPQNSPKKTSAFNINFLIICSKSNKSFSLETCFEQNKMCYTSKKKLCKKLKLSPSASSSSAGFPFFFQHRAILLMPFAHVAYKIEVKNVHLDYT